MKTTKILTGLVVATSLSLCLQACQKKTNNLMARPKNEVAQVLYKASNKAAEKTKLYSMTDTTYAICMENPQHFDNPFAGQKGKYLCKKFFKEMVKEIETNANYKNVNFSELVSPLVYKRVGKNVNKLFEKG